MDNNMMMCPRCGAEMKVDSRYCMKCGNLNYNHPDNAGMKKFADKKGNDQYVVGSGNFILYGANTDKVTQSIGNKSGNQIICFFLNYLVFLIGTVLLFLPQVRGGIDVQATAISNFPYIIMAYAYTFMLIYSFQSLFMKANKKWWYFWVPIYNMLILSEMAFNKKEYGFLTLIPGVGFIVILVFLYKIGQRFKCNGLFTAIFWFIAIPLIGIGNNAYDGRAFADLKENNSLEKQYARRKTVLISCVLLIALGIGLIIYANAAKIKQTADDLDNRYYVTAAKRIIDETDKSFRYGVFDCDRMYRDNGIYYFYYLDISKYTYVPLYDTRDPIEAYIKLVVKDGEPTYYISLTDGTKGFAETLESDLDPKKVDFYSRLSDEYKKGTRCHIRRYQN